MSGGYFYECPSCQNVHDIDPKPLVWFDVDRVDPDTADKLLKGEVVHAVPMVGSGIGRIGTVTQLPLPDRSCDHCGQDGCVDCLPNALCALCRAEECEAAEACTDPIHCQQCPRKAR